MGDPTERIRKLLAKAERAGTEAEAETYTAKAAELMARHGVDVALLAATRPGTDPVGLTRITLSGPYRGGRARLLGWTAAAMRCRWVLHGVSRGAVDAVTIVGHASDRARVELLYASLLVQATRQLARCRPPDPAESVAAYRRSWLYGFAARVHERIVAAEAAATTDGGAPAGRLELVLFHRAAQVERRFAEEFPQLAAARRSSLSGSGFAAGAHAAGLADLGGHRPPAAAGTPR